MTEPTECVAVFHPEKYLTTDIEESKNPAAGAWGIAGLFLLLGFAFPGFWVLMFISLIIGVGIHFKDRPAILRDRQGVWGGNCPYCYLEVWCRKEVISFDCPMCTRRVLRRDGLYCRIPT